MWLALEQNICWWLYIKRINSNRPLGPRLHAGIISMTKSVIVSVAQML
jgi:hypothetical protein